MRPEELSQWKIPVTPSGIEQIWRVASNILNKESRTADKGWSCSLGVGRGANNSSP
jgi:hypothetical protein